METSVSLKFADNSLLSFLYGEQNANLKYLEKALDVSIFSRGNYIAISGGDLGVQTASYIVEALYEKIQGGHTEIQVSDIDNLLRLANSSNTEALKPQNSKPSKPAIKTPKKVIFAYNDTQQQYLDALQAKDIVFGIGAAGTGKTYLAVAMAVSMFLRKQVSKIILTRPVVEAGEKLGFLPGDMREKVDPYLRPLYDALYDMLPAENIERYFATQELQVAPLAFMRGRTLSNAFVILDEGQNTTPTQMKMFLTRLGYGSKMVITGDLTQIDLPKNIQSGLIDAIDRLKNIKEIETVKFSSQDVVRHPLTSKIIESYEQT